MKITSYGRVDTLKDTDLFLLSGDNGTKTIEASKLSQELDKRVTIWDSMDDYIPVEMRRNIWRGKNLGGEVTPAIWDEIAAGTFKGLYIGDYWVAENNNWRIVDINYWLGTGDTACTTPHLVVMPDKTLYTGKMNDTDTTAGGYVGSKMYTEGLEQAKQKINGIFGSNHILTHREILCNAVFNGHQSGVAWFDSSVELPNENMMYGSFAFSSLNDGVTVPSLYSVNKSQLSAFRIYPKLISQSREYQWLRDVTSGTTFAFVHFAGNFDYSVAAASRGVRPVFGIK